MITLIEMTTKGWLAAAAALTSIGVRIAPAELPGDAIAIDYAKSRGLVAAAYQGSQVVLWEFESGRSRNVFQAAGAKAPYNKPLVHFSPGGRRLAFTAEGDAALIAFDVEKGTSAVMVPRRLLTLGITAFRWSSQDDSILVSLGREVVSVSADGRVQWKRRLETQSTITDVAWHPSERFYVVVTDDATVSSYDTVSGRLIASEAIAGGARSTAIKLGWANNGSSLVAGLPHKSLVLLDPDSLKLKKSIPCNCVDFDWSQTRKEFAAAAPPNIALFTESAPRAREIRTEFSGNGAVLWADEGHILAGFSDSAVVLRDARSGKILRTFAGK